MSNLAMQKVMRIRGYNILTDKMELVLKGLKESTFTNGKESTFVTKDNVKIASFDFGSSASISGSSAYIQDDLLAAQLGVNAQILTATSAIRHTEILTVATLTADGTKTATGTVGAEVKFAYVLDTDGNHLGGDGDLTQGAVASATEFSYDSGTNVYTFDSVADGAKVEVAYYPETATAKKIESITTNFTKTLRLEAELMFKDVCTDTLEYGLMVAEKGKISGTFEWTLTEGGDPAVHNFSADFLSDCDDNMYAIYFYDPADMT